MRAVSRPRDPMSLLLHLPRPTLPTLDYGMGAGIALLLLGLLAVGLARAGATPLQIQLYGEFERVDPQAVHAAAAPYLSEGFFGLDSGALEARLTQLPWVQGAEVQRLWPDRIAVDILAHAPRARWGRDQVLTESGELIQPPAQPDTPLLVRAPDSELAAVRADLDALARELPAHWQLQQWDVSRTGDRQARLRLQGQTVRLEFGRDPVEQKVALFAQVALPVLAPQLARVDTVDLRYRNGFAVRWLKGEDSD